MSNLKLPELTYDNLNRLLGNRDAKTIAYATTAQRDVTEDCITVCHHGNPIAHFYGDWEVVHVSNAGWHSPTTTARIHAVLTDNGTGWGCGIKKGRAEFRTHQFTQGYVTVPMPHDERTRFDRNSDNAHIWDGMISA